MHLRVVPGTCSLFLCTVPGSSSNRHNLLFVLRVRYCSYQVVVANKGVVRTCLVLGSYWRGHIRGTRQHRLTESNRDKKDGYRFGHIYDSSFSRPVVHNTNTDSLEQQVSGTYASKSVADSSMNDSILQLRWAWA